MFEYAESLMAMFGSIALLAFSVILVPNAVSLGRRLRLGDLPAGFLLGMAAVSQMFFPVEPTPGVIVDLRIIPVLLAGAFLSRSSGTIAIAMGIMMRLGIGGVGADSGIAAIVLAGLLGMLWKHWDASTSPDRRLAYIGLAMLACASTVAGLLLPSDIAIWFYKSAVPVLLIGYLGIVPVFAWVIDRDISLTSGTERSGRTALQAHGIRSLSLSPFLRSLRVAGHEGGGAAVAALLCVKMRGHDGNKGKNGGRPANEHIEAAMLRLKREWPKLETTCVTPEGLMLVPLTKADVQMLEQISDTFTHCLTETPFVSSDGTYLWMGIDIGIATADDFRNGKQGQLTNFGKVTKARWTWPFRKAKTSIMQLPPPEPETTFQFQSVDTLELLFKKADMLTQHQSWPNHQK